MQEIDEQVVLLLYRRVAGQELEKEEMNLLQSWLLASPRNQALLDELLDETRLEADVKALMAIDEDAALKKLQERMAREKGGPGSFSPYLLRYAVAALLVLALVAGVYSWYHYPVRGLQVAGKEDSSRRYKNEVSAGGANARLQLADGSTIMPDSFANGIVKYQGGTAIQKKEKGQLIYQAGAVSGAAAATAPAYNTITTPRKCQYQLELPDGSRVWLNAGSSLRFPVAFGSNKREVELSGEAYFEVVAVTSATGGKIPFIVNIHRASGTAGEVEVEGTQFNINAYDDEATINTSLVEGRVLLRPAIAARGLPQSSKPAELAPGQQARLAKDGTVELFSMDMDKVIAWKDGFFLFHDTDIETVMRMVGRWYDVNVVYEGKITQTFNAKIARSTPLSQLLTALELTDDVFFTIEGNTVTVKNLQ